MRHSGKYEAINARRFSCDSTIVPAGRCVPSHAAARIRMNPRKYCQQNEMRGCFPLSCGGLCAMSAPAKTNYGNQIQASNESRNPGGTATALCRARGRLGFGCRGNRREVQARLVPQPQRRALARVHGSTRRPCKSSHQVHGGRSTLQSLAKQLHLSQATMQYPSLDKILRSKQSDERAT